MNWDNKFKVYSLVLAILLAISVFGSYRHGSDYTELCEDLESIDFFYKYKMPKHESNCAKRTSPVEDWEGPGLY